MAANLFSRSWLQGLRTGLYSVLSPHRLLLSHLAAAGARAGHPEREAEACEDVFDLVERFAAEVLRRQHLAFGALHQVAERADVRVLQTVRRADGEIELFDRFRQHLRHARLD